MFMSRRCLQNCLCASKGVCTRVIYAMYVRIRPRLFCNSCCIRNNKLKTRRSKSIRLLFYAASATVLGLLWILRPFVYTAIFPPPDLDYLKAQHGLQDGDMSQKVNLSSGFPLLLHQIFINFTSSRVGTIPARWRSFNSQCRTKNSEFHHVMWDTERVEDFIRKEFPWLWDTYRSYPYDVQRTDAARYLIMYRYGGIYIDMDMRCKEPLTGLLRRMAHRNPVPQCVFGPADPQGILSSSFIVCKPQSQVFRAVVRHLRTFNLYYGPPYLTVFAASGAVFLTLCQHLYAISSDVYQLSMAEATEFIAFTASGRTWHQWDGVIITWIYYELPGYVGFAVAFLLSFTGLAVVSLMLIVYLVKVFLKRRHRTISPLMPSIDNLRHYKHV